MGAGRSEAAPFLCGLCFFNRGNLLMPGIVYIASSLDGYIARKDGSLDWLPAPGVEHENDLGFGEFLESIDALVMGRNTYDMVISFDSWAYGDTPVFVLTNRPISTPGDSATKVESITGTPVDVVAELNSRGMQNLYVDGGQTIQAFLRAGQIKKIIITRIPVLLGSGISLFGKLENDVQLKCVRSELMTGGLEQAEYEVVPEPARAE